MTLDEFKAMILEQGLNPKFIPLDALPRINSRGGHGDDRGQLELVVTVYATNDDGGRYIDHETHKCATEVRRFPIESLVLRSRDAEVTAFGDGHKSYLSRTP